MTTSQHWDGHEKVEGQEGDRRPLEERKNNACWKNWNAAKGQRHKTDSVALNA